MREFLNPDRVVRKLHMAEVCIGIIMLAAAVIQPENPSEMKLTLCGATYLLSGLCRLLFMNSLANANPTNYHLLNATTLAATSWLFQPDSMFRPLSAVASGLSFLGAVGHETGLVPTTR